MSFGSGFGGFGANNNNQQTTTGFGGFGQNNNNNQTTGGFGSTTNTGFGATNNNTGGSLFGGGTNTTTGGFGSSGGFGASTQPKTGFGASTGGSLFGGGATTQAPSTGFGGFGSTTTNNTTGGFGSGTTGGSLFGGQSQTQPSTGFGASSTTGGGLFGSSTSTGFGQTGTASTGGFGQPTNTGFSQQAQQTPQNTGTGGTPFQPYSERDGGASNTQQYFQNIVCQQPYTQFSQEELRTVDYNQGRKFGNQNGQAGAFGQSTGFGGFGATANNNNTTTGTGFGSSTGGGLFGAQQTTTPAFGQANTTSTGFGSSTGGGLFGAKPAASTGGLFGSTTATSGQSTGGLFGTSGGTGGFGSSTGGFGSTNNNTTTGGGLFGGQNQAKPGGIFGSSTNTGFGAPASTNPFGQQSQTGGGLFGSTQNNQQQSTGFGQQTQATTNPFGGGFGQNNNQTQQQGTSPFGQSNNLFGQQNQQKPGGLFGSTTSTGGLFGQTQQQQPQQQTNSLFGGNNNQQNQTGGLFGNTQNQAKPGGLFGTGNSTSTSTGNSLFSGTLGQNNQNQQNQSGGLFGQQNQTKSLFGTTNNNITGGSLFGGSFGQNNQQPQNNQSNSLFGSQNQQQPQMGNSLFGNTQNQQQAPQQPQYLTTSINAETPYGNEQLFASLHTPQQSVGPLVTPLSGSQRTRQRAPLPTYRLNPASSTRLITPQKRGGYGFDYSSYGTPGSAFSNASPMYGRSLLGSGSLGRSLNKSMSMNNMRANYSAEDSILSPGAFSPGGMRGGGSGSMKKLKINRSLRTDLFGVDGSSDNFRASPLKKTVSFKADQGSQQPTEETSESDSPTPSAEEQGYLRSRNKAPATNGATAHKEMEQVKGNELAVVPEDSTPSPPPAAPKAAKTAADIARANQKDMEPGAYYMVPTLAELQKMSRRDRANISPFTVGREHAGKIEFSKVDLSNVDLDKICGDIVRIELRTATVYADHAHKPEQGNALNVPSLITLDNSWPRSKGGKLPVYERKGPRFDKHIERLRRVEGTEFVKYDYENGSWIFRVQHFSTYTFDYSDDESMLSPPPSSRSGGLSGLMPRDNGALPQLADDDEISNASSQHSSQMDDTFEFRTSKTLPGAFDGDVVSDEEDFPPVGAEDVMEDEPIQSIEQQDSSVFVDEAPPTPHSLPMDGSFDDDESPLKQSYGNVNLISPLKATPMKPGRSILKAAGGTPWRAEQASYADVEWAQQLQRTLSPKKQDRQALRESQAHFNKEKSITMGSLGGFTKESHPFATSIDVMHSLFGKNQQTVEKKAIKQNDDGQGFKWPYAKQPKSSENDQSDTEKAFFKSLKPSWAADSTIARSAFDRQQTLANKTPSPATLQSLRKAANIGMEDGKPYAESNSNISFNDLAELTEHTDAGRHEQTMWKLAALLFDPSAEGEKEFVRTDKVSNFWKELVTRDAEKQIAKVQRERRVSIEELALLQLSSNNIWAAVETLTAGRDFHLSTMIAQLGAADEAGAMTQKAIVDQIDEWRESNSLSEFSPATRALYELLAGNTCTSNGKGAAAGPENRVETFNITSRFQLDWRRAFALKLWYGITMTDKLDNAIELYAKDVAAYRESVRPVPWFVEQKVDPGYHDPMREDRQDILFGLLKIFAYMVDEDKGWIYERVKLADVISPENVSGNPTDSRLSFHLYQTLSARGIIDFSDNDAERDHAADILTTNYAFQLSSSAENLVDAVFVTLHLHDSAARETAVKAILNRYAGSIGDDLDTCPIFTSLVTELKLPHEWIWNAKALHAKSVLGSDNRECRFLLAGGDKAGAHNVFVQSVAPRCIIEEDRRTIAELLDVFRSKGVDTSLGAWNDGGSLYEDYLRILHVAEKGGDAGEALQLAKELRAALVEMQLDESLIVRVAATEMAAEVERVVAGFARRLGRDVQKENISPAMPMPSDEALERIEEMSAAYYATIGAF